MVPPSLCSRLAGQLAPSRSPDRVCRDYEGNSWHSFDDLASIAAGPLDILGTWNKRYNNDASSAIMVETAFKTRRGEDQALKVELVELNGRFYRSSQHLTPYSCRGKSSC